MIVVTSNDWVDQLIELAPISIYLPAVLANLEINPDPIMVESRQIGQTLTS